MTLTHVPTAAKDALGLLFSGVGMYMSLVLAYSLPNVGAINAFFNAVVATMVGVGSVAAAVTIAWQKVLTTSQGIRADLKETRNDVLVNKGAMEANAARITTLEREAVGLRAKVTAAETNVHTAHRLAKEAINQAIAEVAEVKAEAAAEIAALKKNLAEFHERYHDTVAVVHKLNLESEVREREQRKSNDPDKGPAPMHVVIDNLKQLAALDSMDSAVGMPVVVITEPEIEPEPGAEAKP